MQSIAQKIDAAYSALKDRSGYVNVMQSPRISKVVVSTGIGKVADPKKVELIRDRLARITGQKARPCGARKSIASFKVREGDIIGYQVTLRGMRMRHFLDKLLHIALPRTRDFRGLNPRAIDDIGNLTIGIREHTIFPETADEEQRDVFGMAITVVTSAKNPEEAEAFLRHLGFPLKEHREKREKGRK